MHRAKPRGRLPWRVTKRIRRALGMPPELIDYLEIPTTYDVSNTARFLEGTGIRCPHLTEYLDKMIAFTANNRQIFAANGRRFTGASA